MNRDILLQSNYVRNVSCIAYFRKLLSIELLQYGLKNLKKNKKDANNTKQFLSSKCKEMKHLITFHTIKKNSRFMIN